MFSDILRNLLRFIFLILLQALVLNNWTLGMGIQPFLYVLIILMLPFETAPWAVLLLSFMTGIAMDAFENTLGMHASAATLMGYLRKPILDRIAPRDGYESGMKPMISHMGFTWYLRYAIFLTLIHHIWLHGLDHFRLSEFHLVLLKGAGSTAFTVVLIILYQYLIHGPPKRARR